MWGKHSLFFIVSYMHWTALLWTVYSLIICIHLFFKNPLYSFLKCAVYNLDVTMIILYNGNIKWFFFKEDAFLTEICIWFTIQTNFFLQQFFCKNSNLPPRNPRINLFTNTNIRTSCKHSVSSIIKCRGYLIKARVWTYEIFVH